MKAKPASKVKPEAASPWPLDLSVYDRNPRLTRAERVALASAMSARGWK